MRPWEFACEPRFRNWVLQGHGVPADEVEFVGNGVAFQLWDTYDNPVVPCPHPKALAYRSLVNGANAYHRKRNRQAAVSLDGVPEPSIPEQHGAEVISERYANACTAVSRIGGKKGEMLRSYLGEYDPNQPWDWAAFGARFGITSGSARTIIFRARKDVESTLLAR